jgi:hypothetical protein
VKRNPSLTRKTVESGGKVEIGWDGYKRECELKGTGSLEARSCVAYLSEFRRYPQTPDVKLTIPHLGGLLSFFVEHDRDLIRFSSQHDNVTLLGSLKHDNVTFKHDDHINL